jgi:uncharacterized membrane protein required for colicin V production
VAALRGCYVGYRSGFFPELLRIAVYVVTVVVTLRFYDPLAQFLTLKTFMNFNTAKAFAFVALLAGVFGLGKLLTMLILKAIKSEEGGLINRVAGLCLGVGRWILILSFLFMLIGFFGLGPLKNDIENRSVVGPRVARIAPLIFDFLAKLSPQLAVKP